jgi:uncharacterized protein YoxC
MPDDSFKPMDKNAKAPGGNGPTQYPIIGTVKDNIDSARLGRIRVSLQDGKGGVSPDDASSWKTVQHLTSFFGVVRPSGGSGSDDYGSYVTNSSSYGQWQAPPDIGTKVVCIFINGDTNAGYYIGCVAEPETLHMVPAIGASDKVTLNEGEAASFGGATRLPVTNLNTNNTDKSESDEFLDTPRPVHSYTASIMNQQGILRDPIRGPISSSASREKTSRVGWGVSTPGRPIYEGGYTDENLPDNLSQGNAEQLKIVARRGGHSIVMDDGDIIGRDQLIRIRTALGHQIMMSDDGQTLMILHSNGQSYIELGKEGTVDIFSTNSINMRTQGDFNIHADRDINMHAMENFNLQAKNIQTNSDEVTKSRAGKDYNITSLNNFTVKSSAAIALGAGGQASVVAGAEAFVNGSKVNLNSGSASLSPVEVPIITINAQADTLFDETVGWAAAPAKLLSIASRAPAHYPWVNAGMGIDISNSPNAADNLPEPSSTPVQQVNAQAETTSPTPPAVATVASVPPVTASSPTLGQGTTNAVLAATATTAAAGPAAEATAAGAGIVNNTSNTLVSGINSALRIASTIGNAVNTVNQVAGAVNQAAVAVGAFAQSPAQLAQSGVLKPGASSLVNGLASAGKTLTNTLPTALFAGAAGAESMERLVTNTVAQATSLVNIMQTAQQQLTQAGVINGSESTGQTAGLVAAASTLGTDAVVGVVKQAASVARTLETAANAAGTISAVAGVAGIALPRQAQSALGLVNDVQNAATALSSISTGSKDVLGAIGKGISASKLSDSLGGLGGIANSLNALADAGESLSGLLDSVKGISGSAFSAIKDSFGTLEPNIPQFLSDLTKEAAAKTAIAENTTAGQPSSPRSLSSLVTGVTGAVTDAVNVANDINNTVNSLTGITGRSLPGAIGAASSIGRITGTVNSVAGTVNGIAGTVNSLTSTINSVSGTATGTANAINSATNAVNNITTTLSSAAGVATTLTNLPNTINPGTINNSLVNSVNQLAATAGSVSNTVNGIANTVNNLESTAQQVTTLINSTTGASVNNLANSISGAINNINSLAGAATSLNDGLSGLANAARKTQAGGLAAKASQLSSGISNLPGGIKAFSSVLDKADEALNKIPGTDELTGIMNDLQTEATNGLGRVSSALSSASATLGKVESALNTATTVVGALGGPAAGLGNLSSIASKAGGLTSSIASRLPVGQATQLLSSVSALGAGGASPIRLPSLGINTTNRTSITAQIRGVLGNPKIPLPNLLGDILDETISAIENRINALRAERRRIQEQLDVARQEEIAAGNAFIDAFNSLPEGDPSVATLEQKFNEAVNKTQNLVRQLENVGKRRRETPQTQPTAQDTVPPTTPAAGGTT